MIQYTLTSAESKPSQCNCIGPQPGKKLCPCAIRSQRERVARGDCLVCGNIGGHGGLQCPELSPTCNLRLQDGSP